MLTIVIDFKVNDSLVSMTQCLERFAPLIHCPVSEHVTIDLARCGYLGPDAASLLAAAWHLCRTREHELTVLPPQGNPKLEAFWNFSGLAQLMTGGPAPDTEHAQNENVPVTQFHEFLVNQPDALVSLIRRHSDISAENEDYLRSSIGEVMQNVQDHARSPVGGVFAGRYLSQSRQARIAVVDLGEGIHRTLTRKHPELVSSQMAILKVIEGNWSSQSLPRNRGLGISNLALQVNRMGGELVIVSGDGAARLLPNGPVRDQSLTFRFSGTAVFFTLNLGED